MEEIWVKNNCNILERKPLGPWRARGGFGFGKEEARLFRKALRLLSSFGVSAKTGEREEEEVKSMTGFVREGRVSHRGIYRFTEKILHRTDGSVVRSYFLTQETMLGNPVVRGVAIEEGVIKQAVGSENNQKEQAFNDLFHGFVTCERYVTINDSERR